MADYIDPLLQAAIDRGNALPIGTPQTGHIVDDWNKLPPGEAVANYLQPGQYGTDQINKMEDSDG